MFAVVLRRIGEVRPGDGGKKKAVQEGKDKQKEEREEEETEEKEKGKQKEEERKIIIGGTRACKRAGTERGESVSMN